MNFNIYFYSLVVMVFSIATLLSCAGLLYMLPYEILVPVSLDAGKNGDSSSDTAIGPNPIISTPILFNLLLSITSL